MAKSNFSRLPTPREKQWVKTWCDHYVLQSRASKALGFGPGTLSKVLSGKTPISRILAQRLEAANALYEIAIAKQPKQPQAAPVKSPPILLNMMNTSSTLERIERKIDALLVGFGLDPSA